jgi:hypothetical protein
MDESGRVYRSPIPYEAVRINAAAVYCSDGRIGDQMDDFLHQGLGLPRYDRVACPGGPVALAGRLLAFWESRGVLEQLHFLVAVHEVRQVVLIAHAGCAYYGERLGLDPLIVESEQREDLTRAASAVQRIDAGLEVAGFFARLDGSSVLYEPVFTSQAIGERLRRLPTPSPASPLPPSTSPLEVLIPGQPEPVRVGPAREIKAERGRPAAEPRPGARPIRK